MLFFLPSILSTAAYFPLGDVLLDFLPLFEFKGKREGGRGRERERERGGEVEREGGREVVREREGGKGRARRVSLTS